MARNRILAAKQSIPVAVAQPDNIPASKTFLCWSGMTNTEYNGSYEYNNNNHLTND